MSDEAKLLQEIREKRDLLRLRAHLGTMDMRSQWESLETKWKQLIDRTEASSELEDFGRQLAGELKKGYERLEAAMKDVRRQVSEPCLEHKEVEQLAHELWDRRGRPVGSPDDDWLSAERMLSGEQAERTPGPALIGSGIEEDGFPEPNWR
jgi:hypothetical protein